MDEPVCEEAERPAGAGGRGDRPADGRACRVAGDRPGDGVAAGDRADDDRQHAVRRVWAAADQHDVYATEPVSRDPGGTAAVPA